MITARSRHWLALAAFLFTTQALLAAPFIYVDHRRGSDITSGIAPTRVARNLGPLKTMQAATRRVSPGGTILLLSPTFPRAESFVVPNKPAVGTSRHPLIVDGNGAQFVGYDPVPVSDWRAERGALHRRLRPPIAAGQLYAGNQLLSITKIPNPTSDFPSLNTGQATLWAGQYWVKTTLQPDVDLAVLSATARTSAIIIDGASHVVLRNFHFRGFGIDAVQIRGPARGIVLEDCQFMDNVRAGLFIANNAEVTLRRCQFQNNGAASVLAENFAKLQTADPIDDSWRVDATSQILKSD